MRLSGCFLSDAAVVREGMLNVLGLGVTVLTREEFPANLGVTFVALGVGDPADVGKELDFRLSIMSAADGSEPIASATGTLGTPPPVNLEVPSYMLLPIPLHLVVVPEPGLYRAEFTVADQSAALNFIAKVPD